MFIQKFKNWLFNYLQGFHQSPQQDEPTADDIAIMRLNNLKRMNFEVCKAFHHKHKEVIAYLRQNYSLDPIAGDQLIKELCSACERECYSTLLANAKHVYGIGAQAEEQFEKSFHYIFFATLPEDYRISFKMESELPL